MDGPTPIGKTNTPFFSFLFLSFAFVLKQIVSESLGTMPREIITLQIGQCGNQSMLFLVALLIRVFVIIADIGFRVFSKHADCILLWYLCEDSWV
jgi:hypothetical protein